MKSFFAKKTVFAVIFTVFIFVFSIVNFWHTKYALADLWKNEGKVHSFDDIKKLISKTEETITGNLYEKMKFVESYGLFQNILGKEESNNFAFVKDKDGFMHYASFYREHDANIGEYAKRIRRLQEYVKPAGTQVMFIAPPGKNMYGITEFSEGIPVNNANPIVDELLQELDKNRVPVLDLRESMKEWELAEDEIFFKTDHHWTPQAGLYASFDIVNKVEEAFGDIWDPEYYYRDINQYRFYQYPNAMVGSMGRSAGINYSGVEDFTLVLPTYDGDFSWHGIKENGREIWQDGSFTEVFLIKENLEKTDPYGESRYGVYLSELTAYDKIVNKENIDGPKILFIRDSYFSSVLPFLAPMCSEIEAYWSLNDGSMMDIEEVLAKNQYDYVLIEVYPNNIEDKAFQYFKEKQAP